MPMPWLWKGKRLSITGKLGMFVIAGLLLACGEAEAQIVHDDF